ncbi:Positive regulator of CheA protein activity (CheW) [Rhodovastum atsumiense]|uniref:Chemotaxis protein CheW n=1 Tax=Rhodovastum atsumiense TaxID=504468 RepID=A0A5M6IZL9_9PROT|nr:chemotaxis protein CheW [Rhodovastum atsumiense]KAA5613790.1 chemotaxis protein CheW [Rhodovastum atsumiense]CAH2601883.1 Positive regulator of CheA protein activity (CheW) [Rhodovastum atsumiense]
MTMASPEPTTPLQVLMLGLGDEIFAVEAAIVREILDPVPVTEVPGARGFVGGVVNVRGKVVPLVDLRLRFGMEAIRSTVDTRIVVIEIDLGGDPTIVGMLADKVHEVTEISAASLEKPPPVGMHWRPEFIRFIGKHRDGFVIVPDMDRLFT